MDDHYNNIKDKAKNDKCSCFAVYHIRDNSMFNIYRVFVNSDCIHHGAKIHQKKVYNVNNYFYTIFVSFLYCRKVVLMEQNVF